MFCIDGETQEKIISFVGNLILVKLASHVFEHLSRPRGGGGLVPCWVSKPLPSRNQCMGRFTIARGRGGLFFRNLNDLRV